MSAVFTVLAIALVVMGILPVLTAFVLVNYRDAGSAALRERADLSILLAVLGLTAAALALNRLLNWGLADEAIAIPFAVVLLLVDVASGRWLWQFWRGHLR